jgi:endogenous inhibitor of DNA gyrase (YacG/DUF329 family)
MGPHGFRLYFCLLPSYFCSVPKCPTCGKPADWQDNPSRPFCSERCKLIDFGRWADEEYRVPGRSVSPDATAEILNNDNSEARPEKESKS